MQSHSEKLYDLPQYYDIAFSWDLSKEIAFFGELFKKHADFNVKRILEAACGSGRFIVTLPNYGYQVTGYDISPTMLTYAMMRVADKKLEEKATATKGEMESAVFKPLFDAAINLINSIGYLLSDDDIVSHFRCMGESLRKGGIYIIHLGCASENFDPHFCDSWTMERDGIRITTTWRVNKEVLSTKHSYHSCKMEIDDHGKPVIFEDKHILRLWLYDDLKELIHRSGIFKLEAVYNEEQKQIPLTSHITGKNGNLYYILKKV